MDEHETGVTSAESPRALSAELTERGAHLMQKHPWGKRDVV